ncbi:tRNA uracil 4-sulfurtransferase ThiI [Paenibacillus silviterrae]|uniref:tRNA uracil 4-sulfurtransferase ThiI n=1 Tax=Paenibacillus silviterrae TaxID=3242194 RepID=UPI0025431A9C|nr:tRNA uracil 4-sulfurtransferase ThiI [Paenibacillus chinjuensis]
MKPEWVLLRYGELVLKGRNRHRFERKVLLQVKRALTGFPNIRFAPEFGRILLALKGHAYEAVLPQLRRVFGIVSISPVYTAPLKLEEIEAASLQVMQALPALPGTFKMNVRRVNKSFPHDSQEMNRRVSAHILRALPQLKVNLHQPDIEMRIELREDQALIYCRIDEAAGGFPFGSNGKAMLMLSGGIDSPVAGYLAMRQGLKLEAVHFHSFPYTSERSQQKVKDLVKKLSAYAGPVRLHMVPLTEIQTKIHQHYKENLYITLLRRAMMRIAQALAEQQGAGAIVTGESLGQVASQTLSSMNAISRVVELPIIRPLVCMDKQSIIDLAKQIDTYDISILPYEDCCTIFLPPSPSTNPNLKVLLGIERNMPWLDEAITDAVQRTETIRLDASAAERDELSSFF